MNVAPVRAWPGAGMLRSPWRRTLRLHEGRWVVFATHRDDEVVRAPPFDAIELSLDVLWADVAP